MQYIGTGNINAAIKVKNAKCICKITSVGHTADSLMQYILINRLLGLVSKRI